MPVVVEGIVGLRKALNSYDVNLRKQLDARVKEQLKPIITDARNQLPGQSVLSNWNSPGYERKPAKGRKYSFPSYEPSIIRRGLTYSVGKQKSNNYGFVSLFTLLNKSRQGAIVETAGRASGIAGSSRSKSNNPRAGSQFIGAMNQIGALKDFAGKGKMTTGRLLYAAYARNEGKAFAAIMKAIDETALMFKKETEKGQKLAA